jgi:N-methylhydantoinase A
MAATGLKDASRSATGAAAERRPAAPWRIGVDVGGTFTDVALIDRDGAIFTVKSLSVPKDPAVGVLQALARMADTLGVSRRALLKGCELFVHGSTVATNTILEHTGAKVGLLVTEGFRDSLEIRRGMRADPWDHRPPYPPVLVPRYLRLPVAERIDRHAAVRRPLNPEAIAGAAAALVAEGVESIAICFINSYLNPAHERRAAELERAAHPDLWVSVSSDIIPIAGEYERTSTTVVDAYVGPRMASYLQRLARTLKDDELGGTLLLVKNNGGTAPVGEATRAPVSLTLSGPAAAVGALRYYSGAIGTDNLISMEIGGTSCDLVLMERGSVAVNDRLSIGDYDTVVPSVDVHTIGAGGGSIAGVDNAGVLFVGPRGAGADPGPACYGRGGHEPTVTDAQVVLGRLRAGRYAGGSLSLDETLARRAIVEKVAKRLALTVEEAAIGIVRVALQNIRHALEIISLQRGQDPRRFTLVAGGGAGGMLGAEVGRLIGCPAVYVPKLAGVFCALGMLNSDIRHDYVRSFGKPLTDRSLSDAATALAVLEAHSTTVLNGEGFKNGVVAHERAFDLRYHDQQWDIRVPLAAERKEWRVETIRAEFENAYETLYGHRQPGTAIEIVKLRLTGFGRIESRDRLPAAPSGARPAPREVRPIYVEAGAGVKPVPVFAGADLKPGQRIAGPCLIEEETTTIFAGPRDRVAVDAHGNYAIDLTG